MTRRLIRTAFLPLLLVPLLPVVTDKTGIPEPKPALLGVVPAPAQRGVLIHSVLNDSAAQKAGLRVGDIILSIDGKAMRSPQELIQEIRQYSAETIVSLEYERTGKKHTVKIALGIRQDPTALIGKKAPPFALPQYGAAGKKFAPATDKVYIVDFWATWCGPCEPVRHALENFQRSDKSGRIEIVGITTEDEATIAAFYRGKKPPYPILIDADNAVTLSYKVQGYPTLAVIDTKGVVRFGGFASGGGIEEAVKLAEQLGREP